MISLIKTTIKNFTDDECTRLAAALAFYMAFSLAPMLVVLMAIAGLLFDPEDIRGELHDQLANVIGPNSLKQVQEMLTQAQRPEIGGLASLLGVLGLLFAASGVVAQLQAALNKVWDAKPNPNRSGIINYLFRRLFAVGMVFALGAVVVVSLALSSAAQVIENHLQGILPDNAANWAPFVMNNAVTFVVLTVLFGSVLKFLPNTSVRWQEAGLGAALTALLLVTGNHALSLYLGSKSMETTFGAAGSFALLLLWTYYSAMILLLGAEFAQAWSNRRADRKATSANSD